MRLSSKGRYANLMALARKTASACSADSGDSSGGEEDNDAWKNEASLKDVDDDEAVVATNQELQAHDVLCGRDKASHAHPGNHRFRKIVESFRESYQKARSREEKTRITAKTLEVVRSGDPPGRFLKYDEESKTYYDVGDKYSHEKVSHALRSAKDPNRPKPKRTRVVAKRELTEGEQEMCERVYEEQQRIFNALVENSREGKTEVKEGVHLAEEDVEFDDLQRGNNWEF